MPRPSWRALSSAATSAALVVTLTTVITSTASVPARAAGTPFVCDVTNPQYIYSLANSSNTIYQVATATGAETAVATLGGPTTAANGLALSANGVQGWAVQSAPPVVGGGYGAPTIYRYDTSASATTTFTGAEMAASGSSSSGRIVMGGIDPANGIYYYAITVGTRTDVYGFDTGSVSGSPGPIGTTSGTADNRIAVLATGQDSGGSSRGNGDLVFDQAGRLVYVASSGSGAADANVLNIVTTPLGATPAATAYTPKTIANLSPTNSGFNGIAFDGAGYLYVEYSSSGGYVIAKLNPNTGATLATRTLSAASSTAPAVDLASCTYNNALTVQKDIVNRYASSDQFTVTTLLDAGGSLVGNVGTTAGATTGLQTDPNELSGPLIGLAPSVYDISESGASGANLANYVSTYSCRDTVNSDWAGLSGTGTSFKLTYPAPPTPAGRNIVCTFSNGTLTTTKSVVSVNGAPATSSTPIHAGDTVVYRITVANPGIPQTPTTLTETVPTYTTYSGSGEGWSCPAGAAAGTVCTQVLSPASGASASATFTVTVGALPAGATSVANSVTTSFGACPACTVTNPVQGAYSVRKSVSSATTTPGGTVTYTVTVTGDGPPVSNASFTDDLSGVLDDATYQSGSASSGTLSRVGTTLSWSGNLAAGQVVTVTYSVTVDNPDTGDGSLRNAVVPGVGGSCVSAAQCSTTTLVIGSYTVSKAVSSATTAPGGTVTYTVTLTGVGAPVTGVSFTDNLSQVLDDATYDGDVRATAGTASYSAPTLSWSGNLTAGQVVTVTYSVTVNDPDTGDGLLRNSVVPGSGGSCVSAGQCSTTTPVSGTYTVSKVASATTTTPGGTVTYTITVTGVGAPVADASFTDDLSGVLDDATFGTASATAGTATRTGSTLRWTIANLAAGQVVTVTYSVTVDNPDTGDGSLRNAVVPGSGGSCVSAARCSTTTPVSGTYTVSKMASTATVRPGGTVTYTVTVTGVGAPVSGASFTDELSAVLDDATYDGDAAASSGAASFSSPRLSWSGNLTAGQVVTVSYSVTVNNPDTGDGSLHNAVVPGSGGSCATAAQCSTTTPVIGSYTVRKVASAATTAPGGTVTYTVTVTGVGAPVARASFTDDLSAVLDDATYNGDVRATAGTASYSAPTLSWSGNLTAGQVVVVTYSVTVKNPDTGDGSLRNAVVPGSGGSCVSAGQCSTSTPVTGSYTVSKAASAATTTPGGTVAYTITVTGVGAPVAGASFTDDLSAVLDDATYQAGSASSGTLRRTGATLSWSGSLAAGQVVTVTYSVTVNDPDTGDGSLRNAVVPGSGGSCVSAAGCSTTTPVSGSFTVSKASNPASGSAVTPGAKVTYTVTVTGIGAPVSGASFTDELSAVLDDATYNGDAAASSGAVSFRSPSLSWSGALAAGQVVTVTYSVTVEDPDTGDGVLTNVVTPGPAGSCVGACSTQHGVPGSYTVTKAVDPVAGTPVLPGQTLTYTVTVTGGSAPSRNASFTDDLSRVLDDATFGTASATAGTVTHTGSSLDWSIPTLAAGQVVTVRYTVVVDDPDTGDATLTNAVVPGTGGLCGDACTVTNPVQGAFTVSKSVDPTGTVVPGSRVIYTITVTNGPSTLAGASLTDNLANVLDDAQYNRDVAASSGSTSFSPTSRTLGWTGGLAANQVVTITYSVTVDDPDTGDGKLVNVVVPNDAPNGVGSCVSPGACTTTTPVQGSFTVAKSVSPATSVTPGGTVSYTLTITGVGAPLAGATVSDNLSAVLDDATYNNDVNASSGTARFAAPALTWAGDLVAGQVVTVTYTVTVDDPDTGDGVLTNGVTPGPDGRCLRPTDCTTDTPVVGAFTVRKSADPTGPVAPGDTVSYTLTITGVGAPVKGAQVSDDLSDVLDDAAYRADATATSGTVSYSAPMLSWQGDLVPGQVVTVTYSVLVDDPDTGDAVLANTVTPGPQGTCAPSACSTSDPVVGAYTVNKTVAPTSGTVVSPGQSVFYTLTVTDVGAPVRGASLADDLAAVLDDATYQNDVAATSGSVTVSGSHLVWVGDLATAQTVTITYSVVVNAPDTGDGLLTNAVTPGRGGSCTGTCTTSNPVRADFTVGKSVDPATGSTVRPGQSVTYTLTVTGGQAPFSDATLTDDLSRVLDDTSAPTGLTASAGTVTLTGSALAWSIPVLTAEQVVTITYTVTVADPDTGDGMLTNLAAPGPGGTCAALAARASGTNGPNGCDTSNPVEGDYTVAKTSDAHGTVKAGTVITYTITITGGAAPTTDPTFTDDLSSVLTGARWNGDLAATAGTAVYRRPIITWTIPTLAAHAVVTVSYSVTALSAPAAVVTVNRVRPGHDAGCVTCRVTVVVVPPPNRGGGLAFTGVPAGQLGLLGLALVLAGAALLVVSRRRRG